MKFPRCEGRVFWGQFAGRAAVDGLGVELFAEAQHQPTAIGHVDCELHVCSGLLDRLRQRCRIDVDLRRVEVAGTI